MSNRFSASRCVAHKRGACSAASPNVSEFQFSDFPEEIQKKIKEQGLEGSYQRCSYCDTVWTSYYDPHWKMMKEKEIMTRGIGPGEGTIVFI